jgi:uncharacterized protein YkwD
VARRVLPVAAAFAAVLILGLQAKAATLTRSELALLKAMNDVRMQHGLRPLRLDLRLERAARRHSSTMIRTHRFFHGSFALRIRKQGVRAPRIGENLAWGVGVLARARAIVSMWLASPPHRRNLLHGGYSTVGVGASRGNFDGYNRAVVITTDFAGR